MASLMIAVIYVRLRHCHARHLGAGVSVGAAVCSQGFSLESAARGAQIRVSWDLDTVYRGLTCCQWGAAVGFVYVSFGFPAVFRPVFLMPRRQLRDRRSTAVDWCLFSTDGGWTAM